MKILHSKATWFLVAAVLLLAGLGYLAYRHLPGLGTLYQLPAPVTWPTGGWQTSTPEEQGFNSTRLAEGLQAMRAKHIAIDSLMIIRNGTIVLDANFYPYNGSFPHDIASITKSFMTTLIGIAVDQGKLQLDQPMWSFFPERVIANLDDRKKSITIRHLASGTDGMESGCFDGDMPTLDAMRAQPDWVQAALDRKMAWEPGTHFCYDSPGMHLLSAILEKATGMTTLDFARQNLFEPLGIQAGAWEVDPQGLTHGWGDLHLLPGDAAKLGWLWLNHGVWDSKQIVSAAWVKASVTAQSRTKGDDYGYGWWVTPVYYYGQGRGGQYLYVVPALNTVVVATGAGLNIDQIMSFLAAALLDSNKPLPENPPGLAKLDAVLADLRAGPDSTPAAGIVEPDQAISGVSYACEPNPVGAVGMQLDFNGVEATTLYLTLNNVDLVWPIGLNGNFLTSPDGRALRGHWKDLHTFILESFDVGVETIGFHFDADRLDVSIPVIDLTFVCQVQSP
jgi:CubicO group peptidase (beta-lactamase class C family)